MTTTHADLADNLIENEFMLRTVPQPYSLGEIKRDALLGINNHDDDYSLLPDEHDCSDLPNSHLWTVADFIPCAVLFFGIAAAHFNMPEESALLFMAQILLPAAAVGPALRANGQFLQYHKRHLGKLGKSALKNIRNGISQRQTTRDALKLRVMAGQMIQANTR